MFRPQLILHPTDFSKLSEPAFRLAVDLATQYQARLLILHVVETLGPENITFGEVAMHLEPQAFRQRHLAQLQTIQLPAGSSVVVEHVLAEGHPPTEIERIVKERGVELVVLGTHGRTGLQRLLLGSIAEHVLRHSSCPVLTIKYPVA